MEIIEPAKVHPVIVIGSGASGGMAAWNLTQKGIDVLMLDAGEKFDRAKFWTHVQPWEDRERRGRGRAAARRSSWTRKEQPYLTPADRPFELTRVWGLGGKTNVWGRVSLRYAEMDFKSAERDGWEIPWPISYADVAPYYDQVEQLIGVCGGDDDSAALPGSRFLQPAPAPRCGERLIAARRGLAGHPRGGGPPRQHDPAHPRLPRLPLLRQLRPRLRHRVVLLLGRPPHPLRAEDGPPGDPVERGGGPHPRRRPGPGQRGAVLRPPDRARRAWCSGKVVVVGASCVDTTRLLLNSKSERFPNGIGNSNDVVGRYLCEQVRINVAGYLPALYGTPTLNDRGIGGEHVYLPRFNHLEGHRRDYLRGFGMQFWNSGSNANGANAGSLRPARLRRGP